MGSFSSKISDITDPAIIELYNRIRDPTNPTSWGVLTYQDKKARKIGVNSEGTELQKLQEKLEDDMGAFVYLNVPEPDGRKSEKFVFLQWKGKKTPTAFRRKMEIDKTALILKIYTARNLEITIKDKDQINLKTFSERIMQGEHGERSTTGSDYDNSTRALSGGSSSSLKTNITSITTISNATTVNTNNTAISKEEASSPKDAVSGNEVLLSPGTIDIDPKRLKFHDIVIGEGSLGNKIEKAELDGAPVSVRKVKRASYYKEVRTLRELHHPNLVQMIGGSLGREQDMVLVEEYMNMSLNNLIINNWSTLKDNTKLRVRIAIDVAKGMEYLHSKNILHYNLTSKKILLTNDFTAKVEDYGTKNKHLFEILQNETKLPWVAPEAYKNKVISKEANVYSFGVLMWEILTGIDMLHFYEVPSDNEPPEQCPVDYEVLMMECTHDDPAERPTFSTIIKKLEAIDKSL